MMTRGVIARVTRVTRVFTPRIILDAHIGLVAFFLLLVLWVALTAIKIKLVLDHAAGGA